MKCNCKKEWCTLKYLIKKCPNSDVCYLFQSGVHADPNLQIIEEEENGTLKVKSPQKLKMRYGIALHVQNIHEKEEDLFFTNFFFYKHFEIFIL